MSTTARMAPHYCPYCADQDLRPHEQAANAWECRGCLRVFSLSFVAVSGVPS
jgi:ribosomal protein L37AE/L43A